MSGTVTESRKLQAALMRAAKVARANPGDPVAADEFAAAQERYGLARAVDVISDQLTRVPLSRRNRERVAQAILAVPA